MSELKPYICTGCGGHIDRETLVCRSCGTAYRLDDDMIPVRLVTSNLEFVTLGGMAILPKEYLVCEPDKAMEYTLHEMAKNMAEKILPLIEFQTEYDIAHNEYKTYGRLRVAKPTGGTRCTNHLSL